MHYLKFIYLAAVFHLALQHCPRYETFWLPHKGLEDMANSKWQGNAWPKTQPTRARRYDIFTEFFPVRKTLAALPTNAKAKPTQEIQFQRVAFSVKEKFF